MKQILGYADVWRVIPGAKISFKVSTYGPERYRAELVRVICGDNEPGHGIFREEEIDAPFNGEHSGRFQPIDAGSYAVVPPSAVLDALESFTVQSWVFATTPKKGEQGLIAQWRDDPATGFALLIDDTGSLAMRVGDGVGGLAEISTGAPLAERRWYLVSGTYDASTKEISVSQKPVASTLEDLQAASAKGAARGFTCTNAPMMFAAFPAMLSNGKPGSKCHFNGKIDRPRLSASVLSAAEISTAGVQENPHDRNSHVVAAWDFSHGIGTDTIRDVGPGCLHGRTVNLPSRGCKGHNWSGAEQNWRHAPQEYGAIHFHDDDLYDCGWETDFTFTVSDDLKSGLYCAYLTQDGHEDYIPFVVRPPRGTARAPLALLLPTASYWAYANRHVEIEWRERENVVGYFVTVDPTALFLHEHPEFGVSMYDEHSDGSGVCYASRLRPVLNMRPKERLWQLPADTHIIDWLDAKGFDYDVITEDDLDAEGEALLAPYQCVMTGTHPEYPSKRMMDAYEAFKSKGGRFIYFGGNGFYWRTSYHPDLPGVIEMRRAEDGIRSWMAEGGEYYHSFTGELGGMWRRMGRAPQSVAGTGMTAQGFDVSTYYERTPESFNVRAAFIFEGIGEAERIGDFGIIGGGAAGWEIDRADPSLGTPPHALVVATATNFSSVYHWVKEELTHTHSANTGDTCPFVRCDMVFYETSNGGAVFSASSIAWAGALAHNNYDNNVSRLTENVIRRFLDTAPF